MCKRVYLVGIGPGKENQMTMEAQEILRRCDAVIGARRMVRQAAVSVSYTHLTLPTNSLV